MKKRDAKRLALAAVDEASGRARDGGRSVEDLNTLRSAIASDLPEVIESRLKYVTDMQVCEAVEGLIAVLDR